MAIWKIAGVQMDCRIGDKEANLAAMRDRLQEVASQGARLVVFPECVLTGYCFDSKEEAWPFAESLPGSSTAALADDCRRLGVHVVYGLLEKDGDRLFNVAALVGPAGFVAGYRKLHLPFLGVDRFTTKGDRPPAVHDLGGLRVAMNICYDGAFPELARVYSLLGADLVVLPTNWPPGAAKTVQYLIPARALENHVYYLAVNRVGEERGFAFIGQSRIFDPSAEVLAAGGSAAEILYADIDPERPRNKRIIWQKGKYELDRLGDRRPDMYGPLVSGSAR
jgi:predicted amidohydrolase